MESNIYIIGEIVEERNESLGFPQYTYSDALAAYQMAKDSDIINLHIDSPGGILHVGKKIAALFKNSGKVIKSHNIGDIASIAINIFLSAEKGNRLYYPEKGKLLIHYPWAEAEGNAEDLQEYAERLKKEESELVKELSSELGVEESVLRGYMEQERFLTTEEVELINLATVAKIEFKAVAKFKTNNMTSEEIKEVNKKLGFFEKSLSEIMSFIKPKTKALLVQDVNGTELNIPDIQEIEQLQPGLSIQADDGEYALQDGRVIVVEAGVISEIREAEGSEMEALKAENDSLRQQLEQLSASLAKKTEEADSLKTSAKEKIDSIEQDFKAFKAKCSKDFALQGEPSSEGGSISRKPFKVK